MKTPLRILVGLAASAITGLPLGAQDPAPPKPPAVQIPAPIQTQSAPQQVQRRARTVSLDGTPQRTPLVPLLSRNYNVRITVTEGDKVTEYKLVTAASAISISTPGGADGARSASINGQIEESEEDHLSVALVVSLAIPDTAPVQPGIPPQPGRGQSQSEAFTASLRAKLGVEYPLFASAARTYRLTVTPHENQPN